MAECGWQENPERRLAPGLPDWNPAGESTEKPLDSCLYNWWPRGCYWSVTLTGGKSSGPFLIRAAAGAAAPLLPFRSRARPSFRQRHCHPETTQGEVAPAQLGRRSPAPTREPIRSTCVNRCLCQLFTQRCEWHTPCCYV